MSDDSNAKTLLAYDSNPLLYIDATPKVVEGDVKKWLDEVVERLTKSATILELGSGPGRDAAYLEDLGYWVQLSDASVGFVNLLHKSGRNVIKLNAITDELGGPYNLVLANCVFLHFRVPEFTKVLDKIYRSLKPKGLLAFSVKRGTGSNWSSEKVKSPRFYQYWTKDKLQDLLTNHGYNVIALWDGSLREIDLDKIYVIAIKS